ncbi:alpha/beta hydrolase [Roseomonas sp. CECT 9278]|uniref:alpha/beta hydrolase n=1 Tax=Roseomonas sp. CECT 9278 TaxID=2845823 RepID=UPI001E48A21E|nr:alpha/beta hydrolase [Roseomonas sp. CECT 9278]CAH0279993.1 Acetyl esterase [Roseomonas sp. CECT 9278]
MPLDPGAQRVLDLIRSFGRPPLHELTPDEARAGNTAARPILQPDPPEVAMVADLSCPGPAGPVRLRQYRGRGTPDGAVLPCLLYLHGGGWVIGDLDSHDQLCRSLANHLGAAVIAVDYRLAPEARFPAAVEDAVAALRFVAAEAARLMIDPARIAVGGDSAGGNLAAVLALMGRDGSVPAPCFQMLLYPATDMAGNTPSAQRFTEGYPLTSKGMQWFIDHYAPDRAQRIDWRASPLRAASLAGTPPAFVMTCGHDPLLDEGREYARRLDEEGVHVTHLHVADQMHAYLGMGRMIPAAELTLRQAAAALRMHWGLD